MGKEFKKDGMSYLFDDSFENVSKDFQKKFELSYSNDKNFKHKIRIYRHGNAIVNLYNHIPYLPLSKLSRVQKMDCETMYNVGGIVCTPENQKNDIAIPTLQEIYKYAIENKVHAAFSSIWGDDLIAHYDPTSQLPLPFKHLERRIRQLKKDVSERRKSRFKTLEDELRHLRKN
ncbi:hypothetical protein ACFLZZ_02405 [Nanoarchaeota archaeon]